MNSGGQVESAKYATEGFVTLRKPPLRWRFFQWLVGPLERPQLYTNESQALGDSTMRSFAIINAENGKIIQYTAPDNDASMRAIKGPRIYYRLVPEGTSLIDAIAVTLALERLK